MSQGLDASSPIVWVEVLVSAHQAVEVFVLSFQLAALLRSEFDEDLHQLTLAPWLGDLQPAQLLRVKPAWCAACFTELRDRQLPLYEPLIWSLQVNSLCERHGGLLEDRCPVRSILEFCYACDVTPLHVLTGDLAPLQRVPQTGMPLHPPPPRRAHHDVDLDRCRHRLQAMLAGQEEPLALRRLAAQLGYSDAALRYHFPQECAQLSQRLREYRQQRSAARTMRIQEDIRHAVLTLHSQGVDPSQNKVCDLLPNTFVFFLPEARATLHAVRQDLGWIRDNIVAL